jgi:hypothetical protein
VCFSILYSFFPQWSLNCFTVKRRLEVLHVLATAKGWECSAVPLGQMCFDKVINMCVILCSFVFLIKMQLFPDQDATLVLMGGCLSFSLTL